MRELVNGIEAAADQFVSSVCEHYGGPSTFMDACQWADEEADAKEEQQQVRIFRKPTLRVPDATLAAAEWLERHGGGVQGSEWFAEHSPREQRAITEHLRKLGGAK